MTRSYIDAEVKHWEVVQAWIDAVDAIDPNRGRPARVAVRPLRDQIAPDRNALMTIFESRDLHPYPYPYRATYLAPRKRGRTSRRTRA